MRTTHTLEFTRALLATAALGLAAGNALAQSATPLLATWELKGTITESVFAPGPDTPDIPVGTPFRLLVTFDMNAPFTTSNSTADPVTGLPRPGIRYEYFGAPSLRFAMYAGADCNPCTWTSVAAGNVMLVRDNFANPTRNPAPDVAYDGYSFGMDPDPANDNFGWQVIFRGQSSVLDVVSISGPTPKPLPAVPDPRLTQLSESVFNVWNSTSTDFLSGRIESVGTPTYGTAYILTGRNCSYPDFANFSSGTPIERFDDCISQGRPGFFNRYLEEGGGPGQGDFSRTVNIEFPTFSNTFPAPLASLGTVFGSATFGGPAALPVVKASSYPTDIARNNGNVQAYQQYRYKGAVRTSMPLVADLTYQIRDNRAMPSNLNPNAQDPGLFPGAGLLSATLAIVDGDLISAADMAAGGFNHRTCGAEAGFVRADGTPWPAGAVMGTAVYQSGSGESGAQARLINVVRCSASGEPANADGTVASGEPVSLAPNQSFYVVTTLQTPSRGRWQQAANTSTPPAANGYADAASTLRVTIDPQAPAEVVQALVQNLETACTDCEFTPDERILRIDVKPGSADNSIQPDANGVIPVAIFGSAGLPVDWIDTGSLRLGDLRLRANKAGKAQCSTSDVDLDGIVDLVCQFQNEAGNWQAGQTIVQLAGKLKNSEPLLASDSVRIVR